MDYWMIMKWNELVLDYNVGIHMEKEMDVKNLIDRYENDVDIIIDGGYGNLNPSSVIAHYLTNTKTRPLSR